MDRLSVLSLALMLRASELFARGKAEFHSVYCLRNGDVACSRNKTKLRKRRRQGADKVEVLFRYLERDQGGERAVLVRMRKVLGVI